MNFDKFDANIKKYEGMLKTEEKGTSLYRTLEIALEETRVLRKAQVKLNGVMARYDNEKT